MAYTQLKLPLIFLLLSIVTCCAPQDEVLDKDANTFDSLYSEPLSNDTLPGRNAPVKKDNEIKTIDQREPEVKTTSGMDWRTLVNEYHDILCRQHNGVSTTTDKVRMTELTKELNAISQTLTESEQSDFTAEKSRAMETKNCP